MKANQLKPGHRIITDAGMIVRITRIGRGWWPGSVMIDWAGGWACVNGETIVEVTA